ncbi:MAG: hypothetical protein K6U11_12835 [bacterium]|nr:hypothetical protein [bacterium]
MNIPSPYFHSLNGRLRIKITQIKNSPLRALELESSLLKIQGIRHTKANPITGNLLILYDQGQIGQTKIIDALKSLGYLRGNENIKTCPKATLSTHHHALAEELADRLIRHLAHIILKAAFQSLVSDLI